MKKCTPMKDGYAETYCDVMSEAAKPFTKTSVGLLSQSIVNIKTKQGLGIKFIVVRERGHEGIVLNCCPFCGGLLRGDISLDEKKYLANKYAKIVSEHE